MKYDCGISEKALCIFIGICMGVCVCVCVCLHAYLACHLIYGFGSAHNSTVIKGRSECLTCTFRASCGSARLSRTQVPAFAGSSVRDRGKKGGGSKRGTAFTGGYKGVRTVRPQSVALGWVGAEGLVGGGGCVWIEELWKLECPVGWSQKKNMCAFHWRKFGAIWTVHRKIKNCRATDWNLNLVYRKVAPIWPSRCWVVSLGCPYEPDSCSH